MHDNTYMNNSSRDDNDNKVVQQSYTYMGRTMMPIMIMLMMILITMIHMTIRLTMNTNDSNNTNA